jgi:hypothetical protein
MQASNKVILFKTSGRLPYRYEPEERQWQPLSRGEETTLADKAMRVVDEMESLWEMDHGALELREQFHLLRNYLDRLREGSSKT